MRHLQVLTLLLLCGAPVATISAEDQKPPNVLFVAVDDLNHWLTFMGRNPQARTPNFDRLAKMGLAFTNAYCAVPACEPSRCALMGGQRPWVTGCYRNGDKWKQYQPAGNGLSAQFLKAGYHVAGAGKIYHSMAYHPSEWTEYMSKEGLSSNGPGVQKMDGYHVDKQHPNLKDDDLIDWHTTDYCIEQLKADHGKPFFIACGLYKPHLPFVVPRKYYDAFPLESIQLPPHREDDLSDIPPAGVRMAGPSGDHAKFLKSGRWKAAIQSYLATCAYTDMNLGRLLDAYEQSPQRDNTILVLWTDHGWSFGEKEHWRKFALWEEPTRTPMIWVVPGVTKPDTRCAATVDHMNIYPTLCELAGLPKPSHVTGYSMTELLEDPAAKWDYPAITTHGFNNHAVRTDQFRYIRYANGDEELYASQDDPYEWTNLASDPEYAATKRELAKWLPKKQVPAK
ncbi:sulfatase [Rhodopirellula sp. MGV]|uniref:sulfatase n=1 Tax=Rhodopirellula sp. MGV TaxID=2023130 RepID=UPI000B9796EF|nr:sulfatase [Rhodopirellula sp. MGV]OYP36109.1 iduronate-2-sulfatase [Rhodopirellula sp. MGV]PNY36531.1 iduronate-2-sulfatase [Rhodopirellula baltica]